MLLQIYKSFFSFSSADVKIKGKAKLSGSEIHGFLQLLEL